MDPRPAEPAEQAGDGLGGWGAFEKKMRVRAAETETAYRREAERTRHLGSVAGCERDVEGTMPAKEMDQTFDPAI